MADIRWTTDDVPLLDEARALLGATPKAKKKGVADDARTYGHIVVDEAQDLSPMQLRMLSRRSLNGSMTVVGDIAQSTGAWAHADWDEVLRLLPQRREPRRAELTVGYRIPAPNMALAARVLTEAAPGLRPPRSVRQDGRPPLVLAAAPGDLGAAMAQAVRDELAEVGSGNVAVIAPGSAVDAMSAALTGAGIEHGVATTQGLDHQVTVVPVGMVKGLELDATVVVEPAQMLAEEPQGLRSLYVALTRATKILTLVHAQPLPPMLVAPISPDELVVEPNPSAPGRNDDVNGHGSRNGHGAASGNGQVIAADRSDVHGNGRGPAANGHTGLAPTQGELFGSGQDEDAGAGEAADAHVAPGDLDGGRSVG